jgi:hypothetical protein
MNAVPQNAHLSLSPWQFHQGGDIINLPGGEFSRDPKTQERLASIFKYATIPQKTDAGWKLAPLKDGKVHYGSEHSSRLKMPDDYNKFKKVDFTYFRAFLDLSKVTRKIESAVVTIGYVDDQARMVLFNSKYPNGHYIEANDAKRGGNNFITDFTAYLALGEINTFAIIQVDDNPTGNMLNGGISVKIDGNDVMPEPKWIEEHKSFFEKPGYAELIKQLIDSIRPFFKK